jgi:hypothetical protein
VQQGIHSDPGRDKRAAMGLSLTPIHSKESEGAESKLNNHYLKLNKKNQLKPKVITQ